MRLGCVTYNILKDWDVDKIIAELSKNGFEAVELRTSHAHGVEPALNAAQRKAIAEKFANSRVKLLSYGTTAEFHSPDEKVRRANVEDAKKFIDLAHDTGAWGIKVRPNGMPEGVPQETTIGRIGECLRELGDYGRGRGVEIWMEVHGRITQNPPISTAIMKAARHDQVGVCWNSNPTDIVNGSIKESFAMLRPYIKNVHINELPGPYPYKELFRLLKEARYERYTLCESQESKEPERYLMWYGALWREMVKSA